ncbi:hypothetical protein [Alishewanella sp. HL-SH06]|uniref:hypothetical protein n=1 Tax=Alishewanella sp. HL-SH06 TaxID=3461144 RepID=UPI00404251A7
MFNLAGHAATLNAATQLSLHSSNPGLGVSPAASELSDAPYSRKACTFAAPVMNGAVAESVLSANVTFDLSLTIDQTVNFIGLWAGSTYLGYIVPNNTGTYSGSNITTRQFVVNASTTKLTRTNV